MNVMDPNKITERDGRWYLRSGYLDEENFVFVVSNHAPAQTIARDLVPEALEVAIEGTSDVITLPVDKIKKLLEWPPNES